MDSEPKVRQKAEIEEESRTSDRMGGFVEDALQGEWTDGEKRLSQA